MIISRNIKGQILESVGIKKQFCNRGHDTNIVGRNNNRQCIACRKFYESSKKGGIRNRGWKHYGIINSSGNTFTTIDFDRAYQIQKGQCAICSRHQSTMKRTLNVDHDHMTGFFRGLLCPTCNTNLGRKEDITWHKKQICT